MKSSGVIFPWFSRCSIPHLPRVPSCFCLAVWGFDRDFLGTGQASLIVLTDAFSCAPPQAAFGSVAWPSISKQLPRSPRSSPSTSLSIGQFDRSKASGAPRSQKKRKGFSFCVCVFKCADATLHAHCMYITCIHAHVCTYLRSSNSPCPACCHCESCWNHRIIIP